MLGQISKRGGLLALFALVGIFTASSAHAVVTDIAISSPNGNPYAYGGTNSRHTVTVTIQDPAPLGGVTVALESNSPNLTLTQPGIFIPQGETTASDQIAMTSTVIPTTEVATISGDDGDGSVDSEGFTIRPMEARFLTTNPTGPLQQGGTYTFSVKLSARVEDDQTVDITSSNLGVVASSAVIAAGTNSATFTVVVASNASGTTRLTASFNGIDNDGPVLGFSKISLTSVTAVSATVPKGQTMSVTVNLSTVAVGPHTIGITYTGPVPAGAPTTVIVPDGANSVTFDVPNNWTRGGATVSVTASYGGVTRFVKFNVTP